MALRRDIKAGRSFPENVDVVFKRLEIVCEYSKKIGNNSDLEKRKAISFHTELRKEISVNLKKVGKIASLQIHRGIEPRPSAPKSHICYTLHPPPPPPPFKFKGEKH